MAEGNDRVDKKGCNLSKVFVFLAALTAGTICSLSSKVLMSMKSTGISGETENFSYPLFQTFGMFLGMTGGLVLHHLVLCFRIPFPGYPHTTLKTNAQEDHSGNNEDNESPAKKPYPIWLYFYLIFPAVFDLMATSLSMYGLMYVTVSVYQMLRGSAIVFVALMKQFVLKDTLKRYQWVGIALNCLSIMLVGFSAMMVEASNAEGAEAASTTGGGALLGVMLILLGAFVQGLQYVFEESVMTHKDHDQSTPPLLLIGMEGLWGLLICVFLLYPLAYYYPGEDHGSFENPYNTYTMIANSPSIQIMFMVYFIAVLLYNILACLVTFLLDSVWHAILDNFRPATVWGMDMLIYYCISKAFGEAWDQPWSFVQLFGMFVLLYGTAIYNAPNPGSVKLTGTASSCFIDCTDEYESRVSVRRLHPAVPLGPHMHFGDVVLAVNPYPYYHSLSRFLSRAAHHMKYVKQKQRGDTVRGATLGVHHHGEGENSCLLVHHDDESHHVGNGDHRMEHTNYGTVHGR